MSVVMHVTVCQFFRRGFPQSDDLHMKVQCLSGQRVIEIEQHAVGLDLRHRGRENMPRSVLHLER